ncbi:MAG: PfkB family carbohydrate kinase [Phycisphaerae bacterium]
MSSLLVTGSIALDTVETPSGKAENQLGGSATYFSLAGSILNPVRLVGVVGEDFPKEYTNLLAKSPIDLQGIEVRKGSKTFRWHGRYSEDMNNRTTISVALNVLGEHGPKIPDKFKDSQHIFLANSDPALQLEFLDQLTSPKLIVCDTMDLWIEHNRQNLLEVLQRVDGVVLNDSESRLLTGETNILTAAQIVCQLGPKFVVIKKGEHGAMLFSEGAIFLLPAYPTQKVVDPTGAGDSFAGGFMGYLASVDQTDFQAQAQALVYGTIIASFTVESFSLDAISKIKRQDVDRRRMDFLKMIGTTLNV